MKTRTQQIEELNKEWTKPRWEGITRPYSAEDVVKLRGSVNPECTLAQLGAAKMWRLLHGEAKKGYINSLGALTGGQALQQAKAGIEAIYLSGWQVAADANLASSMYPDQSLYPANSVPAVVDRINNTFRRADQIQWSAGIEPNDPRYTDYFLPIVADAEAGFGGVLNAFELMKSMIEAGAAAVHFEDQLASVKKCGHMGGKVLVPTQEAIQKLVAARLAADVMGVPTLVIARTDADAADLITSDCDPYDRQFITLAGIHSMWFNMFDLAHAYAQGEGMKHYVEKVQQPEFAAAKDGYTFVSHQQEVGTGYFDKVTTIIQGGTSSVTALTGSTEESQF